MTGPRLEYPAMLRDLDVQEGSTGMKTLVYQNHNQLPESNSKALYTESGQTSKGSFSAVSKRFRFLKQNTSWKTLAEIYINHLGDTIRSTALKCHLFVNYSQTLAKDLVPNQKNMS